MGLDAYLMAKKQVTNEEGAQELESKELYYWRKHHDLHGWMEAFYRAQGGTEEYFNCVPVELTSQDLDKLEEDVKLSKLPPTQGFFFGNNPPDEESIEQDLEAVAAAREAIADGFVVYYDSWW